MLATIFRAPDLNQPFLQLNLNGLLDAPNTKFKGFQGTSTSAPAATDLLQQVLPSGTGSTGAQKPAGIWQQILPGLLGTGQGGGSGTGTPAPVPGATTAPSSNEPGAAGLTTAPATTSPGTTTPPASNDNATVEPGAAGVTNPPATTDTIPAEPGSTTQEPSSEPGAGGVNGTGGSSQNNAPTNQQNNGINQLLQGILKQPTQQQ
jgi:hypothetical protein